ncbi:type IV secretion system coupling TraD/TrwB family protein [Solirubrobacter pauli]|uniref:Type IV secretion system coupling TraD/TrwB family protein n=1 Tax=Solirubrobacter pauli TaxID=166793 RepID=A0A660L6Z5_9ACTN|nr:replication-relaxation family protein [Solirubrobacter pauli]RKQ90828.1 type IV secretion system coupling TraD/TrwB family protein [Solirubrobacter pauli]
MTVRHRALTYPTLPVLRSANGAGLIHPDDRRYGSLLVGGQGSGKTAAMLRTYLNDIRDENAAVVVLDPKSELSRLCLQLTPPDTPKRVWFLDLGHPAFGMSPLRLRDSEPLPLQATAIADNIVAALLDINENQLFQSSRRYLYHAVIGSLALAVKRDRRARFEDVYQLLLPSKADLRTVVYQACADTPDLDQTAEFFRTELPQDLGLAGSATAQRLDAPRNKVSGLTGVPPLRRFFNHTSDVALADIVEARDILIVDANMAAIGAENSKACMHFVLRMLHTQLQRQVRRPESERPRVALLADEAHYLASTDNVVDQIATHRAAGLDVTFGLQYLAQLGSGSEHQEKIRKGVINLLQSRFLFRLGDHGDAEEAVRIAMAVYSTMIRDDPDSRARLRVTPEQILNLPVHHCLASWIAGGTRAASFIGQTFPFPSGANDTWARVHLERLHTTVGPYPEVLASTLGSSTDHERAAVVQRPSVKAIERAASEPDEPEPTPSRPAPRVERAASAPASTPEISPVLRVVGREPYDADRERPTEPAPQALAELAFIDRINEVKPPEHKPPSEHLPRLYEADYAILALLDRVGVALPSLIGRAAMPGREPKSVRHRLNKLYEHGLIARAAIGISDRTAADGRLPSLCSLTRFGMEAAQKRLPPAIHPQREWRQGEQRRAASVPHDLHALSWAIELHRVVGDLATDYWRTPRYATGRYPVPQIGNGHKRHPITVAELDVAEGHAYLDVPEFREIKPDLSLELRVPSTRLIFDLLVELDLTGRPSYNKDKLLAYDAFLTGWALSHRRFAGLGTRPVVLFVFRDLRAALACAREADALLRGRIGPMGRPAIEWSFPGRQHLFFAAEPDVYHGSLRAFALHSENGDEPARTDDDRLPVRTVELLSRTVVGAADR